MSVPALYRRPTQREIDASNVERFRRWLQKHRGLALNDYWAIHAWSVAEPAMFWDSVWDFFGIIGDKGSQLYDCEPSMSSTGTRLPTATLNYAENVLMSHGSARSKEKLALVTAIEPIRKDPVCRARTLGTYTFEELYDAVITASQALHEMGVEPGVGVAAYTPSNSEAVIFMLATSALGGVWSSVAAEAGVKACLERLQQTKPLVLLTADAVSYAFKRVNLYDKAHEVVTALEKDNGLKHVVVVGQLLESREPASMPSSRTATWTSWNKFMRSQRAPRGLFQFWRGPAMAPLWVLFSSGTTGKPKAIVHHAGGMILSQKMMNSLHLEVGTHSCYLQFTTTGWMMWNLALSTLANGATNIMYDGSPVATPGTLWDLVEEYEVTCLGCSPRYLQLMAASGFHPRNNRDLSSLKVVQTAGSPLKLELYDFIRDSIKDDVFLANASGGTDICGCFVAGVATLPTYYGEITAPVLGMAIEAWDDNGKSTNQGNMVCTKPFMNQPLCFLDDEEDRLYKETYFSAYKTEVWNQSDWIEINANTRGITMLGRSDGVLNPQGVRFGSAELYNVVEELKPDIEDSIACATLFLIYGLVKRRRTKTRECELRAGKILDQELQRKIKTAIRLNLSERHVPAMIIETPEVPYTHTLKKVEVAVKKLVNGTPLDRISTSAIANPEALNFFVNHPDIKLPSFAWSKL